MREGYKDSVFSLIPNEWDVAALHTICDVRDGTHDSPKYVDNGIPFVTSKNLTDKELSFKDIKYISVEDHENFSRRSHVENGDILLGMIGTVGKPVIVNEAFEFSIKNVSLLKFKGNKQLNNVYALNILKSSVVESQFQKVSNGGVLNFVALGNIRNLLFPLPPLPEQQKIAEILSAVDEKIDLIDQQIAHTTQLKKGLMQRLLTKGIGHTEFKDSPLGKIPRSWNIGTINDFVISFVGGASLKPNDFVKHDGFPVIPKKAIGKGGILKIDRSNPTYCSQEFAESNMNYTVDKSFIITTLRDLVPSAPSIGYMVEFDSNLVYILAQGVYGFLVNNKIDRKYLIQYSNTEIFRTVMQKIKVGSTQVHIRNMDYFGVSIPLPPIEEQQKIANILCSVDEKLEVLSDKKTNYQELKQGLMQQLLTGKIRVNGLIN